MRPNGCCASCWGRMRLYNCGCMEQAMQPAGGLCGAVQVEDVPADPSATACRMPTGSCAVPASRPWLQTDCAVRCAKHQKQHGIIKFARKFARKRPCVCERNVRISLANHGQKRYTNKRKLSIGGPAFLAAPVRTTGEALRERIGGSKRLVGLRPANGYPGDALRDQSFRDHREAAGFRPGPFGRAGCFSGRSDPKQQEREYFS